MFNNPSYIHQGTWSGQAKAILENISSTPHLIHKAWGKCKKNKLTESMVVQNDQSFNRHLEKSNPTELYVWIGLSENMYDEHLPFLNIIVKCT